MKDMNCSQLSNPDRKQVSTFPCQSRKPREQHSGDRLSQRSSQWFCFSMVRPFPAGLSCVIFKSDGNILQDSPKKQQFCRQLFTFIVDSYTLTRQLLGNHLLIQTFGSFAAFKLKCNFLKSNERPLNLHVNLYSTIMNITLQYIYI